MFYPFYTFKRVCFVFFFLQVFCANCMLIMASILHLGKSGLPKKVCALNMVPTVFESSKMDREPAVLRSDLLCENRGAVFIVDVVWFLQIITDDDVDRISLCVRVVAERVPLMKNIFTVECRNSLSSMLDANKRGEEEKMNKVHFVCATFSCKHGLTKEKHVVNESSLLTRVRGRF